MKTLYSNTIVAKFALLVCILLLSYSHSTAQNSISLPFVEDWQSGSFETNNWTTDSDNWVIDYQNGKEAPSAKFTVNGNLNYSSSIVSPKINCIETTEGFIKLKFDLYLNELNNSQTELFLIKVIIDSNYYWLDAKDNNGTLGWQSYIYDISFVKGQMFNLEFTAQGSDSQNIESWLIDNISIYRECPAPPNFGFDIEEINEEEYTANLVWDIPESEIYSELYWDSHLNSNVFNTECSSIESAIKWDNGMLAGFDNYTITKFTFFIANKNFSSLILKLYQGDNGTNVIYYDSLEQNQIKMAWNEIDLKNNIFVNSSEKLWVSITANGINNEHPIGLDAGPSLPAYGNLIKNCTTADWQELSDIDGQNQNWNIGIMVEKPISKIKEVNKYENKLQSTYTGLNIYRSINEGDYELLTFIPLIPGEQIQYQSNLTNNGETYCYKITSVFQSESDACESEPAKSIEFPEQDHVCISLMDITENKNDDLISIYPNPAKSQINIKVNSTIESISLYDCTGKIIYKENKIDTELIKIDASNLRTGIYLINIKTPVRVITKKIVIQ